MRICKKCGRGELTYGLMNTHLKLCLDKEEVDTRRGVALVWSKYVYYVDPRDPKNTGSQSGYLEF